MVGAGAAKTHPARRGLTGMALYLRKVIHPQAPDGSAR
jgi:hypothetical protein